MHDPLRSALRNDLSRLDASLGKIRTALGQHDPRATAQQVALRLAARFPELAGLVAILREIERVPSQAQAVGTPAEKLERVLALGREMQDTHPEVLAALQSMFPQRRLTAPTVPTAPAAAAPPLERAERSDAAQIRQVSQRLVAALTNGQTEPALRLAGQLYAMGLAANDPEAQNLSLLAEQICKSPEPHDQAASLSALATILRKQGRYAEAEPLARRSLALREQTLSPDHPDVATSLNNLGLLLYSQGKLDEAELLLRRSLEIGERTLGQDHPDVATSLNNLGLLLDSQGKLDEAELLLRRSLEIGERTLGQDHPNVVTILNNLESLLSAQDELRAPDITPT